MGISVNLINYDFYVKEGQSFIKGHEHSIPNVQNKWNWDYKRNLFHISGYFHLRQAG